MWVIPDPSETESFGDSTSLSLVELLNAMIQSIGASTNPDSGHPQDVGPD